MNISNGHNGAQGHALPEKHNSGAFAYGLSEDGFGKLARARKACDMLQLLFSEYPSQGGTLDAGPSDLKSNVGAQSVGTGKLWQRKLPVEI